MDSFEKSVLLTPAIIKFEKIAAELKALNDETHPELVALKNEQEEYKARHFQILDKYAEHQLKLVKKQLDFEIQQASEEFEDLMYSTKNQ